MSAWHSDNRAPYTVSQLEPAGSVDPARIAPALLETAQVLGYSFVPDLRPDSPGYGGLMVALRERPSTDHFDPKLLHVRTGDPAGDVGRLNLTHSVLLEREERLCPGRIVLSAASGECVDLFSFGGTLLQVPHPELGLFLLLSPVPLLEITEGESVASQFAAEAEALLAEADAAGGPDQAAFLSSLAVQDPIRLYAAMIHSILDRLRRAETLEVTYHRLIRTLSTERQWLVGQGLWPAAPPTLSELLGSPAHPVP